MSKINKKLSVKKIYWLSVIIVGLTICLSLSYAFAAWQVPSGTPPVSPPTSNELPFLNIGTASQLKSGALEIEGIFTTDNATNLAALGGNVGIGTTTPPEKLTLDGGNFLQTFDSSNLNNLTMSGSINNTLPEDYLSNARGVYISGKYAYIAKGDCTGTVPAQCSTSSYQNGGLTIIDVSNPANPVYVGSVKSSNYLWFPNDVQVVGKYAYVTAFRSDSLTIIDVSNPSNPVIVGWYKSSAYLDGARYLKIVGKYAYVTASGVGLTVIDISNPANPARIDTLALNETAGLDIVGNRVYIATPGVDKLNVIDISNPASLTKAGEYQSSTYLDGAWGVYVSGNYAYVTAQNSDRLTILNISSDNPTFVNSYQNNTYLDLARDIQVSGKYAYIGSPNKDYLTIFNISNPYDIKLVSAYQDYPETGNVKQAFVSGKYIYIAAQTDVTVSPNTGYLTILDPGIDSPSASIGNISSGSINVTENMDIGNNLYIGGGLNVGPGGILSNGQIAAASTEAFIIKLPLSSPGACASTNAGSIYYNTTLNEPCFCNGTTWAQFDGGGGC